MTGFNQDPIHMPGTWLADPSGLLWKVGAVTLTGGERYYMLIDGERSVALMPAQSIADWDVVEAAK